MKAIPHDERDPAVHEPSPGAPTVRPGSTARPFRMGFREFVAFVATCMAVNAFAIDIMLPALPAIGDAFGVIDPNHRQTIILAYLYGFGPGQLVYGPLADRFGRRATLAGGLGLFVVAGVAGALAHNFTVALLARTIQGFGAAATRVVAMSLVRDRYRGVEMARVMSLAMMVFMIVPIVAPALGQLVLLIVPWRWIFLVLAAGGAGILLWSRARMDETLRPEHRRPLSWGRVASGFIEVMRHRVSGTYALASGVLFGGLMGFITSAQQVFQDVYATGQAFPLYFAGIALFMSLASFLNSRWVRRLGAARLGHGALVVFLAASGTHAALAAMGWVSLPVFLAFQSLTLFAFGFVGANFNALAMEPMGHLAGTASSIIGALATLLSATLGFGIGQLFDGTVLPLTAGTFVLGLLARALLWLAPPAGRNGARIV